MTERDRVFDDAGRIVRDVIAPVDAPMPAGMPLLVPLRLEGRPVGHFTMDAQTWLARQRAAMTAAQAIACDPQRRNSGRNSHSAQPATAALSRPNTMPVRISPSCGTSSSGNASATASAAPRQLMERLVIIAASGKK